MAGSTRYYGLGYFDFGDPLGTDFSGQVEIDRWVLVDKQLYGLMSIFGNGVINGWNVTATGAFEIAISEGYGNINFLAARTEFPDSISNLPPNSLNYIYARVRSRTRFAEDVEFTVSQDGALTDPNFLLISQVITGSSAIENIDDSVRQDIGFLQLIRAAIAAHKHRGGSQNPSKIDLESEVKGQLPAFRIADFDAEKITTGTFELGRMPLLDHQELSNVGLLTHPQLDTFVKTLEASNQEIFGEIGTANLLQMILALKFIYDDPESMYYLGTRQVDENMINEICVIPGITPDDRLDFDNSTASINTTDHYIEGVAPTTGTSFYVNYDTALAWNAAYSKNNVVVVGDTVTLAFSDDEDPNVVTIEGFESATSPSQVLSSSEDGGQELFKKETVVTTDNASITANAVALDVLEGFYSGRFTTQQSYRVQYLKEFSSVQDWSSYDSFVLYVKCIDPLHGPVRLFFYDEQANKSPEFDILLQDEVTDNPDLSANNFETRVIDIGQIPFMDKVKGFVIYSDDTDNPFHFFIDYINVQRAVLLPEEGTLLIRYATSQQVTFSQIEWDTIEPLGTEILVRARSANGTVFLTRAEYTPYLGSGDVINLKGTDIEIEVTFTPDSARLVAPILQSMRILILTEAEIDGYEINSYDEFIRGDAANVVISEEPAELTIGTPIYVGSYYFALGNSVNQVVEKVSEITGGEYVSGELALFGNQAPVAPNQLFKAVEEEGTNGKVSISAFFEPRSVVRLQNRNFVVADTYNDRVLEFDESGTLVAGLGSVSYQHSDKLFPLSACLDIRTSILYIVWSQKISFRTVDVRKITIHNTSQSVQIQLIRDFDKILGLTTSELESVNAEGQIMPVYLSLQNAALVQNLTSEGAYVLAASDTVSSGLDTDSVFYKAIGTAYGIPLFIGNFAYIDGIFCPTYAQKTETDGFVIANSTIGVKEFTFTDIDETLTKTANPTPIIEVDKNNNVIYGTDKMLFSPFVPGRVDKLDDHTLLIGGLKPTGQPGSPTAEEFNFRAISGDKAEKIRRKTVLNKIFFEGTPAFVGAVIVLDTRSDSTSFEYVSSEGLVVSDVDVDTTNSLFVIAETSFKQSGRVIKVDSIGNIVFSFGEGLYGVINDVKMQLNGSIVVST